MDGTLVLALVIISVALTFDYINGFHDAANSVATIVATRVLSPGHAVMWAAFWNFAAAFGFGTQVAKDCREGRQHGRRHSVRHSGRTNWRHCLGFDHVVFRITDEFFACAPWWLRGRGNGKGGDDARLLSELRCTES